MFDSSNHNHVTSFWGLPFGDVPFSIAMLTNQRVTMGKSGGGYELGELSWRVYLRYDLCGTISSN